MNTPPFHDAIRDSNLLGSLPQFRNPESWTRWIVYSKARHGYALTAEELAIFQHHTKRKAPLPGGYPEGVAVVARQCGKTDWHASELAYDAAMSAATGVSERGLYYVICAQDARSAMRAAFAPVRAVFDHPLFRALVAADRQDSLELTSGATIACYPARPPALRGLRAKRVYLDELAFMIATDGRPTDTEMLRAARPCLATTGGKLFVTSSPMGQAGALYDLYARHFGREDSPVLVWQGSASEMNSTLPADYLERMREDDPEAYRSEVLGEFRAGVSALLDSAALDDVVMKGVREVQPQDGERYAGAFDASAGRSDSSGLAIGRRDGRVVRVECVRAWTPPFDPETAIQEAAAVLKSYRCHSVQIDRFAAPFVAQAFQRAGIRAEVADATTSEHHIALVPHVNAGTVVLPDNTQLLRELRGLIRRAGRNRDTADHVRGGHDDLAAAVSGVVALLAKRRPGDHGVTIGEPETIAQAGRFGDPAGAWARGMERQAAIHSCNPSGNCCLPPGWESPENWA